MNQRKAKNSLICYYLLINFAANSKKSATFLKLSNCWQYIPAFDLTLILSFLLIKNRSTKLYHPQPPANERTLPNDPSADSTY